MDKLNYKELLIKVREILNKVDPENLEPGRPSGAPENEYDLEVAKVVAFILSTGDLTENNLSKELEKIWMDSFNKSCSKLEIIVPAILKKLII